MDHPQVIRKLVLQEQEPSRSIDCLGLIGQHPRSDMVDASQPLVRYFLQSKPFAAMFKGRALRLRSPHWPRSRIADPLASPEPM